MSLMDDVGNILGKYTEGSTGTADTHDDFDRVAQSVPQSELASGISAALQSDQTPPMPDMVANLFGQSNGQQRASILNQLISSLGPGVLSGLLSGGALSGLGGLLSHGNTITPEQAQQVSPDAVKQIAAHAERQDPSIIDRLSQIYAQHPTLIKTLGEAALTVAMIKIGNRQMGR